MKGYDKTSLVKRNGIYIFEPWNSLALAIENCDIAPYKVHAVGIFKTDPSTLLKNGEGESGIQMSECPVGELEEITLYLNGTDLPAEVYQGCDINYVIERISAILENEGRLYSWWEEPQETALYFQGKSYETMASAIDEFIGTYPLCQKCIVGRIA